MWLGEKWKSRVSNREFKKKKKIAKPGSEISTAKEQKKKGGNLEKKKDYREIDTGTKKKKNLFFLFVLSPFPQGTSLTTNSTIAVVTPTSCLCSK